ncbi:MAG: amino acid adenylation domain-containing protein [Prevotella sp.]|jgi:D-alanine--poly(phosphoribitol) ligase subunit 1|nr:amino acid adenylation domain-containing protein [Prevotella sp.]MCI1282135.1 amino acid adenylation domain-containing protein [Prevotella sp.]
MREKTGSKDIVLRIYESFLQHQKRYAFCIDDKMYTYEELGQRIAVIREQLAFLDSKIIGLVANDDIDTYASILALWMEGMCYVPLHPEQPLARCEDIISQVGLSRILDSSKITRYGGLQVIATSVLSGHKALVAPKKNVSKNDPAYILFTSGSTGRPKGVCITFSNVDTFVDSFEALGFHLNEEDRCLQMFDLTFDLSVGSFLPPLLYGACAYTIKPGRVKWQEAFRLLDDYKLTFALMVPSVIHYLRPYLDEIEAPQMRYSLFCGEALAAEDVALWQHSVPNAEIWNVYGPTENTIYCTAYRMPETDMKTSNGILSIGKKMKNTGTIIVDDQHREVPIGVKGELCLSGSQLTPGYWDNEEKTKESVFYLNETKWYLTGDICSMTEDGDILYYGRKDSQVKIQGYRIELSEIECVARRFYEEKVATVAVPIQKSQDNTTIALAVEKHDEGPEDKLLEYLKCYLPAYMIPSDVIPMPQFPQNANNKIDRKKIKLLIQQ